MPDGAGNPPDGALRPPGFAPPPPPPGPTPQSARRSSAHRPGILQQLLRRCESRIRQEGPALVLVAALVYAPFLALAVFLVSLRLPTFLPLIRLALVSVELMVALLLPPLVAAALAAFELAPGEPPTKAAVTAWRSLQCQLGSLLLVVTLLVFAGLFVTAALKTALVLLVPHTAMVGLHYPAVVLRVATSALARRILLLPLALTVPALVIEVLDPISAMTRSARLTRTRRAPLLLLLLPLDLVDAVVPLLFTRLISGALPPDDVVAWGFCVQTLLGLPVAFLSGLVVVEACGLFRDPTTGPSVLWREIRSYLPGSLRPLCAGPVTTSIVVLSAAMALTAGVVGFGRLATSAVRSRHRLDARLIGIELSQTSDPILGCSGDRIFGLSGGELVVFHDLVSGPAARIPLIGLTNQTPEANGGSRLEPLDLALQSTSTAVPSPRGTKVLITGGVSIHRRKPITVEAAVVDLAERKVWTLNEEDFQPSGWWSEHEILAVTHDHDRKVASVTVFDLWDSSRASLMEVSHPQLCLAGHEDEAPIFLSASAKRLAGRTVRCSLTLTEYLRTVERSSFAMTLDGPEAAMLAAALEPSGRYWVVKISEARGTSLWLVDRTGTSRIKQEKPPCSKKGLLLAARLPGRTVVMDLGLRGRLFSLEAPGLNAE